MLVFKYGDEVCTGGCLNTRTFSIFKQQINKRKKEAQIMKTTSKNSWNDSL